jgi:hypothetical protein
LLGFAVSTSCMLCLRPGSSNSSAAGVAAPAPGLCAGLPMVPALSNPMDDECQRLMNVNGRRPRCEGRTLRQGGYGRLCGTVLEQSQGTLGCCMAPSRCHAGRRHSMDGGRDSLSGFRMTHRGWKTDPDFNPLPFACFRRNGSRRQLSTLSVLPLGRTRALVMHESELYARSGRIESQRKPTPNHACHVSVGPWFKCRPASSVPGSAGPSLLGRAIDVLGHGPN